MLIGIIGFFAGIIGGMGMGGGTILIPALVLFASIDPKIAQSINLLSSIPMTIAALIIHTRKKNVETQLVLPIALFGIVGAIFGSTLAEYISSESLRRFFGIFLLIIGIFEIQKGISHKNKT
ncbi:MAG: TSUP family transporter [Intestinibacter sp.]|uniref:TSUP family transporter n=1 Tax=Intestinibacter sp. TaxID=1965304 RepID=UPI003F163621